MNSVIQIPPGFNYTQLIWDFTSFVLPFIGVAAAFAAFVIIKRVLNLVR